MVLPGPHEPNLAQLNNLMQIFTNSMIRLTDGIEFSVHGQQELEVGLKVQKTRNDKTPDKIEGLVFSSFPKKVNLRRMDLSLYDLVYDYLQQHWYNDINLLVSTDTSRNGHVFDGAAVSYPYICFQSLRYGAADHFRGESARYAYIDQRVPVEIQYLFHVKLERRYRSTLTATLAVVRRFVAADARIQFPWVMWANDLGVAAWTADQFAPLEVINITRLSGHLVHAPIKLGRHKLWITVAYDHGSPEADIPSQDDM
ncbi:hypothetical protein CONPUDRAFT_148758 [Coniophora puteana RWD-64-598 SS2]|uniref:Uncharacterized protein n=1 Tax=Coniophora puteana (strain RWD-64-598) TaxID=741705 RepID=A0A5M3N5J4_CONPW|nr:uncharacterized protein CONPUDRAFT_148758 [Coniophora puteana RWD-64-598 SS2]EIW86692.1 hypothetical protein CONPUDRAFT_148758 [Coniophora puteana RWD-64-598 SS2]